MDLKDQLQEFFPDHEPSEDREDREENNQGLWIQDEPLLCKFEKRHGKPTTIIDGYTGNTQDFKTLAKELKSALGVGGSTKNEQIIIQGDLRGKIMDLLKDRGFQVKRVGG